MEKLLDALNALPFDTHQFLTYALVLMVISLLLGVLGRFIFGKRSQLNHAVSSAIGITFIYAITIVLHSAGGDLSRWIAPLPFVTLHGETLSVFSFYTADYTAICAQVLSMVILAFLANLMDAWLPRGKHLITWFLCRVLTVALALVLHVLTVYLFNTYLPLGIVTYAPTILLFLLVLLLLVGALKFVVGAVLMTVSPVIAAFYTFFFASMVGKQLTKAVLTTLILSGLVLALNYIGCSAISIAAAALVAYIPLLLVLLVLWFVIGKLL